MFSRYLYDNDSVEKTGKKTQPPRYKGLTALWVHTVSETLIKLMFIKVTKSVSYRSKYLQTSTLCIS